MRTNNNSNQQNLINSAHLLMASNEDLATSQVSNYKKGQAFKEELKISWYESVPDTLQALSDFYSMLPKGSIEIVTSAGIKKTEKRMIFKKAVLKHCKSLQDDEESFLPKDKQVSCKLGIFSITDKKPKANNLEDKLAKLLELSPASIEKVIKLYGHLKTREESAAKERKEKYERRTIAIDIEAKVALYRATFSAPVCKAMILDLYPEKEGTIDTALELYDIQLRNEALEKEEQE